MCDVLAMFPVKVHCNLAIASCSAHQNDLYIFFFFFFFFFCFYILLKSGNSPYVWVLVDHSIYCQMVRWIMIDEVKKDVEGSSHGLIDVLSQNLSRGT
jgi:hypothetical protein